jgi:hypothetical protein
LSGAKEREKERERERERVVIFESALVKWERPLTG